MPPVSSYGALRWARPSVCVCVVIVMSSEFRHLCSTICLLVCLKTRMRTAQGTSRVKALYYSLTTSHTLNNLCLTLFPSPFIPFLPDPRPVILSHKADWTEMMQANEPKKKGQIWQNEPWKVSSRPRPSYQRQHQNRWTEIVRWHTADCSTHCLSGGRNLHWTVASLCVAYVYLLMRCVFRCKVCPPCPPSYFSV